MSKAYRVKLTSKPKSWSETVKYVPIMTFEFLVYAFNKREAEEKAMQIWLDNTKPRLLSVSKIKDGG